MMAIRFLLQYSKKYRSGLVFAVLLMLFLAYVGVIPAQLTQMIIDEGFIARNFRLVLLISLSLTVLYVLKSFINYYSNSMFISISQKICSEIRLDAYDKVLNLPMSFFGENESGYVNSRLSEINSLQNLFSVTTFKLIVSLFEFAIAFVILVGMNVKITFIVCLPLPVFYFIAKNSMCKYSKLTSSVLESSAKYSGKLNETLKGMEEIKISMSENIQKEKMKKHDVAMMHKAIKQSKVFTSASEIITLCMSILNVFIYVVGGYFIINENLSLGEFMALSIYISKLYSPVISFSTISLTIQPSFISLERLQKFIFDIEVSTHENSIKVGSISHVEAKNLSFGYSDKPVFNNLSFIIKSGDIVKLNGVNGSGKSTLIKLILKLYPVSNKQMFINGTDINNVDERNLREKISVVSQKIFVFNDTLENNIGKDFWNKLILFGIDKENFSIGIDDNTVIGENGFKLSGGQIQKIAIARALIKNADVYIFDEAASNIDFETKEYLKMIIQKYLASKIVIIIDHSDFFDDIIQKTIDL